MSEADESDLFPTNTTSGPATGGPRTPPHNNLNAAAPGELSPPRSQGGGGAAINGSTSMNHSQNNMNMSATAANGTSASFMGPGQGQQDSFMGAGAGGEMLGVMGGGGGHGGQQGESGPGEWKSKKAQDEMQRAWEFVVDKDWSAREFGDVVLQAKGLRDGS